VLVLYCVWYYVRASNFIIKEFLKLCLCKNARTDGRTDG
jgi:hypothetical protein